MPIGNSFFDYVNARLSIALLRSIAPLSIVYLVVCVIKKDYLCSQLAIIAALEASFYLLVFLPRRARLQAVCITIVRYHDKR